DVARSCCCTVEGFLFINASSSSAKFSTLRDRD
ncbi:unnamed protein product, partial [Rotaria magnacalcarata]